MKFFKKENNDSFVIVGCGRLGANLANKLSEEGKSVYIIDKDKAAFRKLAPAFGGIMITGDISELTPLEEVEIEKARGIILVTDRDNVNMMMAQYVCENYDPKEVIVRIYNPELKCLYQNDKIKIICPGELMAKEINDYLEMFDEEEA